MVNKKPSLILQTEKQNLTNRFNNYLTGFATNKKAIEKAVNKLGADENHWNGSKWNVSPHKGWVSYLNEDFEMGGKDDIEAQKNVDDDLRARIDGVSNVFCRAIVNYYSDLIKHETSNTNVQLYWNRLQGYLTDTTNQNDVEKDFLGKNPLLKLINDMRTKATGGGTTHTTTSTDYSWDNAPIGLCQRWGGNPNDTIGGKKVLVGFSMRFLGTET